MSYAGFVRSFVAAGGRFTFGVTGGGPSLKLIDELVRAKVRYVGVAHETTAAAAAGAYARQARRPALALAIKGPGFANLVPGILSNAYEGYPSVSISESYAWQHRGARRHKWLDHRWPIHELVRAHLGFREDEAFFAAAWSRALSEPSGPVHIDLGEREEIEAPCVERSTLPSADLAVAMASLRSAERPLVICGSWCLHEKGLAALRSLRVPVFTTPAAKGFVPEDGPFAAGVFTGAGKPGTPEAVLLERADLVVGYGLRGGELIEVERRLPSVCFDDVALVRAREFPDGYTDQPVCLVDAADLADSFLALDDRAWGEREISLARRSAQERAAAFGWSPYSSMEVSQGEIPDAVHVLDTGNFTVVGEHFLAARDFRDVIGTPNGRFLGLGIAHALGAALADSSRPTLLWIGDGGLRPFASELALMAELNLAVCVCVMNDGAFGSIRGRALSLGLDTTATILAARDLPGLAAASGLDYAHAESEASFRRAIAAFARTRRPCMIDCVFEPEGYREIAESLR